MGKEKLDLSKVDLASFSAQKFFGMKGIGCLIKKEKIVIEPFEYMVESQLRFIVVEHQLRP